jgi:hypothetical protein
VFAVSFVGALIAIRVFGGDTLLERRA